MPTDGSDNEKVSSQFAEAGMDVDSLGDQLQDEGAKSFVKSWKELMAVIPSKGEALKKTA